MKNCDQCDEEYKGIQPLCDSCIYEYEGHEKQVEEMTVEQVCKALGKNIKIVN